jgi:AraC family transcriptional regulator
VRRDIVAALGEFDAAHANGEPPTTLVAGSAPGESGVFIVGARYDGRMHFQFSPSWHTICFQMSPARIERRVAGRVLCHEPPVGSLAIGPAGIDCAGDADDTFEFLLVGIDPAWLALAAAEGSERQAQLIECFWGYDYSLLALARTLAFESAGGYPNGPLFWNEVASRFIDRLAARHMSAVPIQARGMLSGDVLKRIREYVVAHLDEPIEVAALAGIAARGPFHFTRVFTQTVGLTPHRLEFRIALRKPHGRDRTGPVGERSREGSLLTPRRRKADSNLWYRGEQPGRVDSP